MPATLLRPGMRAVDLGAAPGGWTWQLVQRGLQVTAVDNGPLKGSIARRSAGDARARRRVSWFGRAARGLARVRRRRAADRASRSSSPAGSREGAARRAIFNLKLPMKKRYDEVRRCKQRIAAALAPACGTRSRCASSITTARK